MFDQLRIIVTDQIDSTPLRTIGRFQVSAVSDSTSHVEEIGLDHLVDLVDVSVVLFLFRVLFGNSYRLVMIAVPAALIGLVVVVLLLVVPVEKSVPQEILELDTGRKFHILGDVVPRVPGSVRAVTLAHPIFGIFGQVFFPTL